MKMTTRDEFRTIYSGNRIDSSSTSVFARDLWHIFINVLLLAAQMNLSQRKGTFRVG